MTGALSLDYVRGDEIAGCLRKLQGHVLGIVAFGAPHQADDLPGHLQLNIPVLGGYDRCYEVWSSSAPVHACNVGPISAMTDGQMVFGSMQFAQGAGDQLETLANRAYAALFDFIEDQGFSHLWRVWNYFPQINDAEGGLERYRCFNVGRHEAFVARRREIVLGSVPAASALGSESGPFTVYFLAGKHAGRAFENPRQVSAYNYPEQYGPRSPTFARAMMVEQGDQQCLIISGTASVVGHETLHHGDVRAQTEETLRNIHVLLDQGDVHAGQMLLKVYLRHADDLPLTQELVQKEFGSACKTVYLQSDICRTDLLLEIEGVHFSTAGK